MVSKSKYWISGKHKGDEYSKTPKKPYARVLVLCQVPLETIMRVKQKNAVIGRQLFVQTYLPSSTI